MTLIIMLLAVYAAGFWAWIVWGAYPVKSLCSTVVDYICGILIIVFLASLSNFIILRIWLVSTGEQAMVTGGIAAATNLFFWGMLSGYCALDRAVDAGGGRLFAALAIIPPAGLWVMFARPDENQFSGPDSYKFAGSAIAIVIFCGVFSMGILFLTSALIANRW